MIFLEKFMGSSGKCICSNTSHSHPWHSKVLPAAAAAATAAAAAAADDYVRATVTDATTHTPDRCHFYH